LQGTGDHKVLFANADDKLYLWINNRYIEFGGSEYTRDSAVLPRWSKNEAGDSEPVRIGAQELAAKISRIRVLRDVYYTQPNLTAARNGQANIEKESNFPLEQLINVYENPQTWSSEVTKRIFTEHHKDNEPFRLRERQYFPMGDNSPASLDARVWPGPNFVAEEMLIGRAMFIYWPHSLNRPIKYFPNFKRMGFIR
jgi:signal peptidase I